MELGVRWRDNCVCSLKLVTNSGSHKIFLLGRDTLGGANGHVLEVNWIWSRISGQVILQGEYLAKYFQKERASL